MIIISDDEKRKIIFSDTGEYIELNDTDEVRIITQGQKTAIAKAKKTIRLNEDMKLWNKEMGGFIFVLFKYCDKLMNSDITPSDLTKLFYLATYVDYSGNLHMTRTEMQDLLKLTRQNFDVFFNKMIENNIIIKKDIRNIIINKDFFTKGEIEKEMKEYEGYTRAYINTIRYLYLNVPEQQHRQLGMYFKLIPYIHRQKNVLCWNPSDNSGNLQPLKLSDVKEILGYNQKSVKPFIESLLATRLENGESILGFFVTSTDFWKCTIIVNPRVCYGGNFDIDKGQASFLPFFKSQT